MEYHMQSLGTSIARFSIDYDAILTIHYRSSTNKFIQLGVVMAALYLGVSDLDDQSATSNFCQTAGKT